MEGMQKLYKALEILEEKAFLSFDQKITLDYILSDPAIFPFLDENEEDSLLKKLDKEGVIEMIELFDMGDESLATREITVNLKKLKAYKKRIFSGIKQSKKIISIFKIPKNKSWKDVSIRFKNDFDVIIKIGKKEYESDYERMGFADYRIKDSNERAKAKNSWKMLHLMSLKGGRLSLDELDTQKRNKFIKQKQETSSLLKKVFDQEEDPFEEYDKERNEYISKLKLISESEYQKDFRDTKIKDKSENNDPFKDLEESYSRLTEG